MYVDVCLDYLGFLGFVFRLTMMFLDDLLHVVVFVCLFGCVVVLFCSLAVGLLLDGFDLCFIAPLLLLFSIVCFLWF